MSLLSLCENGNLEGVKVALGELNEITCVDKYVCVLAAMRSKEHEVVITLVKHLGFDHVQHTSSFGSFIERVEKRTIFQSLHSHCQLQSLVSPALSREEMMHAIDKFARLGILLTQDCITITFSLFQISKIMRDATALDLFVSAMEARFAANHQLEAHKCFKTYEEQLEEKEAIEKRQEGRTAKEKRNKELLKESYEMFMRRRAEKIEESVREEKEARRHRVLVQREEKELKRREDEKQLLAERVRLRTVGLLTNKCKLGRVAFLDKDWGR